MKPKLPNQMKWFLMKKHDPKQSMTLDEIKFDGWIYPHWLNEFNLWITSKSNHMYFYGCEMIQLDELPTKINKWLNEISCYFKMENIACMEYYL